MEVRFCMSFLYLGGFGLSGKLDEVVDGLPHKNQFLNDGNCRSLLITLKSVYWNGLAILYMGMRSI